MALKSDVKFEEKLTSVLTRALQSVKIGILMGSFCPK